LLENDGNLEKDTIAIRNQRICYWCATPVVNEAIVVCSACGSEDIDDRRARPKQTEPQLAKPLPHPWHRLQMRKGGTVLLSGNKGSGKTSICMKLSPTIFISTEQELREVAHSWYRIGDKEALVPLMSSCRSWEELEDDLLQLGPGDRVIVDSISQLASGPEASRIVKNIIEHIRRVGAMAWFIAQFTKQGDMLGPNMLNHMVDVVCKIPDDNLGMRRLSASKNRFGELFAQYFALTGNGVEKQAFDYAYTVEGSAGNYSLHLYPMNGAKLGGVFDQFLDSGIGGLEGLASAAIKCAGYKTGFAEPSDIAMRRKFAEDHELTWITPEEAQQRIIQTLEGRGETREHQE